MCGRLKKVGCPNLAYLGSRDYGIYLDLFGWSCRG